MSALVAVFNRNGAAIDPLLPQRMLAARPQRGLHGTRAVVEDHVALAHQHLWLLPQEWGEEQPLQEAHLLLSADVRLDNRRELGSLLGLPNADRRAASDALLLLLSYRRWGEHCLDYLLGDFSFALWDAHKSRLFCARDALGANDLSYFLTDDLFLAASEISQLLAHPVIEPQINENRVAAFLAGSWDDQQETYFKDINYLPPAHAMIVSAHETRLWRYWDIDEEVSIRYKEEEAYVEQYRSILDEAVRCRLRATGPIAVSLSGGLDSTALAALAAPAVAETDQKQLRSFSYAFDELTSCDERRFIKPVVDRYPITAEYVPCDDAWTLKNLPEWPCSRDFVLADPYAGLPDRVMKAAQAAGVRLLLAGYFGDTLAAGGQFWALDMLRDGRFDLLASTLRHYSSRALWRINLYQFGLRQLVPPSISRAYRRGRPRQVSVNASGIHPQLIARSNLPHKLSRLVGRDKFSTPGLGHRYRALMTASFNQGIGATRHQYNQHGLEVASPYFDRRLVEFMMAVPAYILGRPGWPRLLQRRAMIGYLPEIVWQRRQRTTFYSLMRKGLQDKERETVKCILADSQIGQRGYVREDWLKEQLKTSFAPSPEWSFLWSCISLELWLKRFWS